MWTFPNAMFLKKVGFLFGKNQVAASAGCAFRRKPQTTQNVFKGRKPFLCVMSLLCVLCSIRRQADCQEETTHEDLRWQTTLLGNIAFPKRRFSWRTNGERAPQAKTDLLGRSDLIQTLHDNLMCDGCKKKTYVYSKCKCRDLPLAVLDFCNCLWNLKKKEKTK